MATSSTARVRARCSRAPATLLRAQQSGQPVRPARRERRGCHRRERRRGQGPRPAARPPVPSKGPRRAEREERAHDGEIAQLVRAPGLQQGERCRERQRREAHRGQEQARACVGRIAPPQRGHPPDAGQQGHEQAGRGVVLVKPVLPDQAPSVNLERRGEPGEVRPLRRDPGECRRAAPGRPAAATRAPRGGSSSDRAAASRTPARSSRRNGRATPAVAREPAPARPGARAGCRRRRRCARRSGRRAGRPRQGQRQRAGGLPGATRHTMPAPARIPSRPGATRRPFPSPRRPPRARGRRSACRPARLPRPSAARAARRRARPRRSRR